MLDSLHLASLHPVRVYLLEKVQHMIGGFAKGPESPPGKSATMAYLCATSKSSTDGETDVMHSYLGLAALALYGEAGVKNLDPALCISKNAAANLQRVAWRQ